MIVIIAFPWKEQTHTSSPIYTNAAQKRLPKRIIILRAHSANSAHWILYACMPNMNAKHVCTCHLKENPKETREKQERVVDIECANAMQTNTIHNVRYTSCTCNSINAANWQAKHNFALKNPFKTWKPEPSKWFCLWPFCKTGFFASLILLFALDVCIFWAYVCVFRAIYFYVSRSFFFCTGNNKLRPIDIDALVQSKGIITFETFILKFY